jgi:dolichyl-phosphate-mannose-protein mannosyltransferase
MSRSTRFAILGAVVLFGGWLRCSALSTSGFSEDEINIVQATTTYEHLDFSANAEHPMLAKLAAFGSVEAAAVFNRAALRLGMPTVSRETAIRLPMALVGGVLTTIVLYLLASELFADAFIPLLAALLWAVDVNATSVNRTAKEDTLFLFFFLLAAWLYARAKRIGTSSVARARPWYVASAAGFGLMMASKYMPHYYGLHALVYRITDPKPGENRPNPRHTVAAMAAAFLVTNFAVLLPSSWTRLTQYFAGQTLTHTGYLFAHHLYVNSVLATPGGVPPTFYLAFLATKVPLAVLAVFSLGLVEMIRRPTQRGFVFARVLLVFFLVPFSLLGSKFVRYMLPLLVIVDLLAAVGIAWLLREIRARVAAPAWRVATVAAAAVVLTGPIAASVAARPYFGLARNSFGARLGGPGYLFPDDEFNDTGVREAVAEIARVAAPGAVIASDATTVVEEYLVQFGRPDIQSRSISRDGLPVTPTETWVLAQDGHTYFENAQVFETIKLQRRPWQEWTVRGAVALGVYRLPVGPPPVTLTTPADDDYPTSVNAPPEEPIPSPSPETRSSDANARRADLEAVAPTHAIHPMQR